MEMSLDVHYYNVAKWLSQKFSYHKFSSYRNIKNKQVNIDEVWECDLGYNVGEEKNKKRPALVISNNKINRTGKVSDVGLSLDYLFPMSLSLC